MSRGEPPFKGWWGRNRASRMSCAQAKAHAMQREPRTWAIGEDGRAFHAVGAEFGICGAAIAVVGMAIGMPPPGATFDACPKCVAILNAIDALAGAS